MCHGGAVAGAVTSRASLGSLQVLQLPAAV